MAGKLVRNTSDQESRAWWQAVEDAAAGERAVRARLDREGIAVAAVRAVEPSLEDVFVALVAAAGGAVAG